MHTDLEPFVDADEIAARIGESRRNVIRMAREGKLTAYLMSGTRRHTYKFRHSGGGAGCREAPPAKLSDVLGEWRHGLSSLAECTPRASRTLDRIPAECGGRKSRITAAIFGSDQVAHLAYALSANPLAQRAHSARARSGPVPSNNEQSISSVAKRPRESFANNPIVGSQRAIWR